MIPVDGRYSFESPRDDCTKTARPPSDNEKNTTAARVPYGPLGLLDPPTVELEGGLSKEVVNFVSAYLAGQTGTMELATQMEKIRQQRLSTQQTPTMET